MFKMYVLFTILIITLAAITTLFIKEKSKTKVQLKKVKDLERNNKKTLEYIDALWESQKGMIMDEKLSSLTHLISRISHELNTPLGVSLTSLSFINELLLTEDCYPINNEAKPMVELALSSLKKSISLVETFAEVTGDQSYDKPNLVKISNFLEYACSGIRYNKTIHTIDEDFTINIAQYNLSIIIKKIMDNSYDFTLDHKNDIEVEITAERRNKDLILKVKDNGIGIPAKDIEKIFSPLYTTRRGSDHHGLGLAIAYNILSNQYDGKIECLSTMGVGTTMTITVPNIVSMETAKSIS